MTCLIRYSDLTRSQRAFQLVEVALPAVPTPTCFVTSQASLGAAFDPPMAGFSFSYISGKQGSSTFK